MNHYLLRGLPARSQKKILKVSIGWYGNQIKGICQQGIILQLQPETDNRVKMPTVQSVLEFVIIYYLN